MVLQMKILGTSSKDDGEIVGVWSSRRYTAYLPKFMELWLLLISLQ
jgi:hypothetical protein